MANLYAVNEGRNVCKHLDYHMMTLDGKNLYNDETADDYIAKGMKILNEEEFRTLWDKDWEEYENELCGNWEEISAEWYNEQLNVLPPLKWYNGGFFMSEMYMGAITGFYQEYRGKYYTSLQNHLDKREDILNDLRESIKNGTVKALKEDTSC